MDDPVPAPSYDFAFSGRRREEAASVPALLIFPYMPSMPNRRHCRLRRSTAGFTILETLIVIALVGIMAAVAAPFIQRILRREKLRSGVREVYSIVLAARMQAVKRNTQAIVWFDLANHRVFAWCDNLPYNYVQDAGEPAFATFEVPKDIYFRFAPNGGAVDSNSAVAFDTYNGNAALQNMVVFRGDGTLLPPGSATSGPPQRPSSVTADVPTGSVNCNTGRRCRGIFMSDEPTTGDVNDRNTFRISVDDFGSTGKASLLKWIPTSEGGTGGEFDYVPGPWKWAR